MHHYNSDSWCHRGHDFRKHVCMHVLIRLVFAGKPHELNFAFIKILCNTAEGKEGLLHIWLCLSQFSFGDVARPDAVGELQ